MAIFELDGEAPDLPPDGRYWIADSAIVIGLALGMVLAIAGISNSRAGRPANTTCAPTATDFFPRGTSTS